MLKYMMNFQAQYCNLSVKYNMDNKKQQILLPQLEWEIIIGELPQAGPQTP
jgi:hypothetical protein